MGLNIDSEAANTDLELTMRLISDNFTIHPIMLLPVLTLLVMANKKYPPVPTILTGASLAVLLALIFQRPAVLGLAGETQNVFLAYFRGVWQTLFDGFSLSSGNTTLDDLMTRGGMSSMLNTVWLILCAMVFGAVMEHTGLLKCLVNYALSFVSSTGSLIATTLLTCIGANLITSDQYISVVLPGRMYKLEFQNHNLDMKNLSRTLEDAGTITSPLIPWNTCGAYMAGTLGVATFAYLPYCFFNLVNPVIAAVYGFLNFKIVPASHREPGLSQRPEHTAQAPVLTRQCCLQGHSDTAIVRSPARHTASLPLSAEWTGWPDTHTIPAPTHPKRSGRNDPYCDPHDPAQDLPIFQAHHGQRPNQSDRRKPATEQDQAPQLPFS